LRKSAVYVGVSDHVLVKGKSAWVGFWDRDSPEPVRDLAYHAKTLRRSLLEFSTGRGFHLVALDLVDWRRKVDWWNHWHEHELQEGLDPDYTLRKNNVLRIGFKNGHRPEFRRAVLYEPSPGSRFHIENLNPPPEVVSCLYPEQIDADIWQHRFYLSDPSSTFDYVNDVRGARG